MHVKGLGKELNTVFDQQTGDKEEEEGRKECSFMDRKKTLHNI